MSCFNAATDIDSTLAPVRKRLYMSAFMWMPVRFAAVRFAVSVAHLAAAGGDTSRVLGNFAFAGPHPLGQRTTKGDGSPVRSLSSPLFL